MVACRNVVKYRNCTVCCRSDLKTQPKKKRISLSSRNRGEKKSAVTAVSIVTVSSRRRGENAVFYETKLEKADNKN